MTRSGRSSPARTQGPVTVPELLAPAGSPEAFRAAIAAGADAVYLSGKRFGARKFASNFSDNEIEEAVRYAHARGVRVYVTVNTLIHDRELSGVAEYLVWLYGIGTDAVLVQDLGVAALAREIVPGLALHASTQMTIHNTDGVLWAAGHGISRVVLSRELTLAEVQRISYGTRGTGTGLEVFSHGALCYSYSGQCLLSSVIGGRSGNRGMCAQPCRKPYALVAGKADEWGRPQDLHEIPQQGHYLLSPRDLCTYSRLPDLAGRVASIKIEGRMKSPQYVAIVVSAYRRALDAIAKGSWKESPETIRDLTLAFSRGFTKGYLFGDRHDTLMSRGAPDNRGLEAGIVTAYDQKSGSITVQLSEQYLPAPGDGIGFSGPKGENDWGFSLNTTPVVVKGGIRMAVPRAVPPGTRVAVTFSRELENRANRIIADPPPDLARPVPLDLALTITPDGHMTIRGLIQVPGKDAIPFEVIPDFCMEPARSQPLGKDQLEEQIRKTGGSRFRFRNISIDYAGNLFAPVSKINQVRRDLLAKAEEILVRGSEPSEEALQAARGWLEKVCERFRSGAPARSEAAALALAVYTDSLEGVLAAAGSGAGIICLEPDIGMPGQICSPALSRQQWAEMVQKAQEICQAAGIRFILKFPRITRDAFLDLVLPCLPAVVSSGVSECMVENTATAHALLHSAPGMRLSGAAGLNIFNHASAESTGYRFRTLTLSPELSGDEIRMLVALAARSGDPPAFALIVQGASEAMITDDCIPRLQTSGCPGTSRNAGPAGFLGLRDETGRVFPVMADGSCRTRIGNAAELCLLDHLPAIRESGVREVAIDCRGKTSRYTQEMTAIYEEAIGYVNSGQAGSRDQKLTLLKERARKIAAGGITAGHFLRGLME